jgi:hypothetical protein
MRRVMPTGSRRFWLACLLALCGAAASLGAASPAAALDPALQGELQNLLQVLDQTIMQGPRDSPVYKSYQTVRNQMQAARIMFAADAKSTNASLLKGAYFSPNRNGVSWVVVDPVLLKTARSRPSLALTLLMNAMVMAESFFEDPANFAGLYQDPVGSYLFSMDALYQQALFVRDFIKPHYPQVSDFETFLLDSLQYENMASSSMFILGVDQSIVYGLRGQDAELKSGRLLPEGYFKLVNNMAADVGKKLDRALELNAAPADGGTADDREVRERTRYIAVISGLTLLKYGVGIMSGQLAGFSQEQQRAIKPMLDAFNLTIDGIARKINPLADRVMDYRKRMLERMGL